MPRSPQILEAEVDALSHDGRGVARPEGRVVFIDQALPGELVRFCSTGKRRSVVTGRLLELVRASPDRVPPRCRHFGVCGGCALQHLRSAAQVESKQRQLKDNLERIAKTLPDTWAPPIVGPAWSYRRKARLGVRYVPKKGGVLVGFRERHKSYITPLAECSVLEPRLANLLPALPPLIEGLHCFDRVPQIEAAAGDNAVALVFRHLTDLSSADRDRLRHFAQARSVQVLVQSKGPDSVEPLYPEEPEPLHYRLSDGIEIRFEATDFVQVNGEVNDALVRAVLGYLEPGPGDTVLDLFCGLGNFTLPIARTAGAVYGLEGDPALVERARRNAGLNGVSNAEFVRADLYAEDPGGSWLSRSYDKVLLDPPRTGAIDLIKRIDGLGARRVVYVSCNPATLARDAEVLVRKLGYVLKTAGVVDMFPHTSHVESIAVFEY